MPHVLIVSDAPWTREEVSSALPVDATVQLLSSGRAVRAAIKEESPDLVILDSQIGSMGAIAVALDIQNEASGGRMEAIPLLLLLDRQADVFLSRNAKIAGYLVKPLDPLRLRRAVNAVLAGGTFEDRVQSGDATNNYRPTPDATAR